MKQTLKKLVSTATALALLITPVLTLTSTQTAEAAFPGLNGRILFVSSRNGTNAIYTMRLDGSDVRQLTSNSSTDTGAEWSPDGTKITFSSNRDGNSEIYVMNADGSSQARITNNPAFDARPAWSPDGTKIVFHSDRDGNQEIFTMNIDGTDVTQVTQTTTGTNGNPAWSPDGTKLTFNSSSADYGALSNDIIVTGVDGSNATNVVNHTRSQSEPRWSPDGSYIVFVYVTTTDTEVFSVRHDGSELTNLTNNSATDAQPDYSADGQKIFFRSNRDGDLELYTMNPDGSNQVRLTSVLGDDHQPRIQPLTIKPSTISRNPVLDAAKGLAVYSAPANHTDAYEQIDPASVAITAQPQKGSVIVNQTTGEITYTPNQRALASNLFAHLDGFFFKSVSAQALNQDSFSYQICSTANSELCTITIVTVSLAAANLANTGTNNSALYFVAFTATGISISSLGYYLLRKHKKIMLRTK